MKIRRARTQTKKRDLLIARVEKEYTRELDRAQARVQAEIDKWIALNSAEALQDAGESALLRRIEGYFRSPKRLRAFFGRMTSLIEADVEDVIRETIPLIGRSAVASTASLESFAVTNASLITSVPGLATDRLGEIIRNGSGRKGLTLQGAIQNAFNVSESKANFWARDQTLKLHADITKQRHIALGIDRYYWTTSQDDNVRDMHADLGDQSDQGITFSYKKPPIISEDGRRGNPGEDFNCRCTAYPAL